MGWIDINYELPKVDGEYLIYSKYEYKFNLDNGVKIDKVTFKVDIEEFTEDEFMKVWNNFVKTTGYKDKEMKQTITHWMPLPKAPKN